MLVLTFGLGQALGASANVHDSQQIDTLTTHVNQLQSKVSSLDSNASEQDKDLLLTKVLALISILLNIRLGYIIYKRQKMNQQNIDSKVGSNEHLIPIPVEPINPTRNSISEIKTVCDNPPIEKEKEQSEGKESKSAESDSLRGLKKQIIVKFGTFLVDENGSIRTEQRILTDDNSSHLFRIEYEEGSDVATYTINSSKKSAILADVQTFQNFTEQFVVTGTPTDVFVEKIGKLRKSGRSWVVTNKLKVLFK